MFFERERGWKGLLIEADPKNFKEVLSKNRKVYASPTCLGLSNYAESVRNNIIPILNNVNIVLIINTGRISTTKEYRSYSWYKHGTEFT